jgi:DNA-binding NtrC family response regulator
LGSVERGRRMKALPGFEGLVGESPSMQALFERIRRLAPFDMPVLIVGETGTGKELVARALHRLSGRGAGPFVALTCGLLTLDDLQSWRVAGERRSLPRTARRRADLLGSMRGGTLLLDEVSDLAVEVQAALRLRIAATSLGGPEGPGSSGGAAVRLVATTHRDLLAAIRAGRFRENFYYSLRRAVLTVPPLRARLEDLPLLVEHVLHTVNARYGVAIDGVTDGALRALEGHAWPGNVRELEAVLEAAMVFQGQGWLDADPLALAGSETTPVIATEPRSEPRVVDVWDCPALALALAAEPDGVSTRRFVRASGLSRGQARRELGALVRQGRLRRVGAGRAVHYVRP